MVVRSVPWPKPVKASDPCNGAFTPPKWKEDARTSFKNCAAATIGPMVWEDDGPMPILKTSKTDKNHQMALPSDGLGREGFEKIVWPKPSALAALKARWRNSIIWQCLKRFDHLLKSNHSFASARGKSAIHRRQTTKCNWKMFGHELISRRYSLLFSWSISVNKGVSDFFCALCRSYKVSFMGRSKYVSG